MDNSKTIPFDFQAKPSSEGAKLLERTRLSQMPNASNRSRDFSLTPDKSKTLCKACAGPLDRRNEREQRVGICLSCLVIYSKIDLALDELAEKRVAEVRREKLDAWRKLF